MNKTNIRRLYYQVKHKYFTLNNAVIFVGVIIASGWVWGSLNVMQRNYRLQKDLDSKSRQLIIAQIDVETAKLEQRFYKTTEYQELEVRKRLNLVAPGESVLILPANSDEAKAIDKDTTTDVSTKEVPVSNFGQWMNFLFGGNASSLK